ncbi:MAG: glycosyltransferase [Verrucomicrobia bacterium]|nr:glycosyltransferase [Verrucomicrobiota bacterium]
MHPIRTILLIGNSEEFQFSMKLFPEMLLRLLRGKGVNAVLIRPKTYLGKLAPWAGPLGKWLFYVDKFLIFPFQLKRVLRREGGPGVIVHVCDHSNAMYVHSLAEVPHMVTCHDMMPMRSALGEVPQNPTSWTGKIFQKLILSGLKKAKFIVCVSTATQRELLRLARYPEGQTRIVFNSLNYPYAPMPISEARARVAQLTGGDAPYLLHVGGDAWYKNRAGVLTIYAEVRRRLREKGACALPRLVYAGPSLHRELVPFLQEDPAMERDVIGVRGVDNETLRALYSAAELLLFPSWDEGFGWPIIEAQACGCRVVTTGQAPMTEVGGEAAFFIDPHHPIKAAGTVLAVLEQEPAQRVERIAKGIANAARFKEDVMIEGYLDAYLQLLAPHGEAAR